MLDVGHATDTTLVSASELSLYGRCKRKWAFAYILGIRDEAGPAAALGIEVDDRQLQPYFREGTPFDYTLPSDAGYIASSGLAYYPRPGEHTRGTQYHWSMPSPGGIVGTTPRLGYHGYMDLWMPDGAHVPDQRPGYPVVIDFKTTSDFRWAKSPEGLASDNQAMLYAIWALYSTRKESVDLNWLYLRTKGAKAARRVHLRVFADRSEYQNTMGATLTTTGALDALIRIDATAHAMLTEGAGCTDPLTLEANPEACSDFGGCPHQSKCNLGPSEIIDSLSRRKPFTKETPNMLDTSFLAKMKAKSAMLARLPEINPPESLLPDAPAVGIAAAPTAPTAPAKRFRRTKAQMAAAAAAAGESGTGDDSDDGVEDVVDAPPTRRPPAAVDVFPSAAYSSSDEGDSVHVTWGVERYQPMPFSHFDVGPHSTTGTVRPGETRADAVARLYAGLDAFASKERMMKAEAFRATVGGTK